jgi:hypothetical protein
MVFHFEVEVLTVLTTNTTVFWDVMQFSTELLPDYVEPHPTIQYSSLFLFFNDNTSVLY